MKYRKKPIEVEAWRIDTQDIPSWIIEATKNDDIRFKYSLSEKYTGLIYIDGFWVTAEEGDWIIKGVEGEI